MARWVSFCLNCYKFNVWDVLCTPSGQEQKFASGAINMDGLEGC